MTFLVDFSCYTLDDTVILTGFTVDIVQVIQLKNIVLRSSFES